MKATCKLRSILPEQPTRLTGGMRAEMMEVSSNSAMSEWSIVRRLGYRMHHMSERGSFRAAAAMKPAVPANQPLRAQRQPYSAPTLSDPRIRMAEEASNCEEDIP